MLLQQFYERTLPPTGNFAIFQVSTRRHVWVDSIAALVDATVRLGAAPDIYFGVAAFDAVDGEIARKQAYVSGKKAFYLDLDAGEAKLAKHGPEKVYATQDEAITDVVRFCKETSFVPSLIVSSGEGLHLYWELGEVIDGDTWTAIAQQFQKFGVANGLKIDSAVTADSARILRPIGTMHPNGKEVTILRDTGKVYSVEQFKEVVGVDALSEPRQWDTSINDDVMPDVQGPPKTIRKIIQNCGAVRHAFKNQDKVEEPLWRLMIGLAKHTVEGFDAAVALSSRHPKYNERQTREYFERWSTGPSTCERLEEFCSSACSACPHKGKIKSPILLGEMNSEEVQALPENQQPTLPVPNAPGHPWDGMIPLGFDVINHRGVLTLIHYFDTTRENELGEEVPVRVTVPISHEIFWLGHWSDPSNPNDTAQVTVFMLQYNGRVEHTVMNQELVASRAELAKFLASKGIHTTTDKRAMSSLEAYIKSQLQRIKSEDRRPKLQERFGLTYLPDKTLVAAQGENVIYPNGKIVRATLTPALQSFVETYRMPLPVSDDGIWQATVWKEEVKPKALEFVKFMQEHYSSKGLAAYRLAFMLNAASPLMAFTEGGYPYGTRLNSSSFVVSLYSKDGGKGKTTLMNLMALTFGSLGARSDKNPHGSTALARTGDLSFAGTMPAYMDEMGETSPQAMSTLVSAIANGAARRKKLRNGGIVQEAPWSLICTMASNVSLREMVMSAHSESNAIQARMIELDVNDVTEHSAEERGAFAPKYNKMVEYGGALGAIIHLLIVRNGAEAITERLLDNIATARKIINSRQIDRFQDRALGAMITVHQLLDSVGLAIFDLGEMCETFRVATAVANEFVEDNVMSTNGLELLSQMLHDLQQYTVITATETRRTGGNFSAFDSPINRVPDKIKVRHITGTRVSYVAVDAMREWCQEKKIRAADILGPAKTLGVLRHVYAADSRIGKESQSKWAQNFNLTKGMRENGGGQIRCYCFSLDNLYKVIGQDYNGTVLKIINGQATEEAPVEEAANG